MPAATIPAVPHSGPTPPTLTKADDCVMVIFGAAGDLTHRKLLPALYDVACSANAPARLDIIGISREQMTEDEYRASMKESTSKSADAHNFKEEVWAKFASRLKYMTGDFKDPRLYAQLALKLSGWKNADGIRNVLLYLAIPPSIAPSVIQGIGAAGLAKNDSGWTRVVVEKPFGRDLESAQQLNDKLLTVFREKQIYRIDHYLGKETVQNILVFRFGNSLFEPIWNRNYVDHVEITAAESLGVENRAAFYEETGALRDVVANHLLQLLTLTAMEAPVTYDADSVREGKVQVLRSIKPMTKEQVAERTVRGQYGPGAIRGQQVPGYRQEPHVKATSTTETFTALELYIENWRWAGVPFYVRAGKRLATQLTEIAVHLKRTPQALFSTAQHDKIDPNVITLRIQPEEGITVAFEVKQPGLQMHARTVHMDFSYRSAFGIDTPVAYETLLLDVMRGDATLFSRRDEVEAQWKLITPIEEAWKELPAPKFPNYDAGSDGPAAAAEMMARNNARWRPLVVPDKP